LLVSGSGAAAIRHTNLVQRLYPNLELAMWRRSPSSSSSETSVFELFDEVQVGNFKPDLAIVAGPAVHHLEQAKFLISQNAHVLVEKPLAISSSGVEELFQSAKDNNRYVQVGYNLRYSECLNKLGQLINQGELGKIQKVNIAVDQYLPDWRPGVRYQSTVSAQKSLGGGALLELSHEIDYALRLFGTLSIDHAVVEKISDLEIDVEDTVVVTGKFMENGLASSLLNLHLGMTNRAPRRNCEVSGSITSARWDGIRGTVEVFDPELSTWKPVLTNPGDIGQTYERQLSEFIEESQRPLDLRQHERIKNQELRVLETIDAIRAAGSAKSQSYEA
jgi:predicted dehydrogenase